MDLINKIYNIDCLEGLKQMESCSVDVTFTSPPYNDSSTKSNSVANERKDKSTHTKYITLEDHSKDWFEWQCSVIDELLRVSKKSVIYNIQALANNRENVWKLFGHYADKIHHVLIWDKDNVIPAGRGIVSNQYEFIIIFDTNINNKITANSNFFTNIIHAPKNKDKTYSNIHKAVMSKPLADIIIKEFTKEGDLVLDPFMGLGTTALSCIDNNRKWCGFELAPLYYEKCLERIKNYT